MPQSLSQKISGLLSALDDVERREATARVCGWIALVLLAASFAPDLILVMDFSRPYQIAQFSQDEFWFMEQILKLQNHILTFDGAALRDFGSPFAYGFPFWLIAAFIALPFHSHVMLMALFLRLVFMVTKYAAFFVVYRRMLALTQKPLFALLALGLLLIIPAFIFDGKIIGPEYLIMLLMALSWSALFSPRSSMQALAAFYFAAAVAIKINIAALALIFVAVLFAHPRKERRRILLCWGVGALVPLLLFLIPANPLKEILAIGTTHRVDYGLKYLPYWYGYNALEFDNMLKGGWRIDFIDGPLFLVFLGYAVFRAVKMRSAKPTATRPKGRVPAVMPIILGTFFAAVLMCFLTSLNSLMHPWFVFAPFLLLIAAGSLLIGAGREGSALMLVFVLVYVLCFGARYAERWQHRIDKFEYIAATEPADVEVANWIAKNCPAARAAVIDYNLLWPPTYNGHLQKMWTLIEVEDYRRANGDATELLKTIDVLLLKADRVHALVGAATKVPGAILGNFFPDSAPFFIRQHDFPHLSIFARDGVCNKQGG